ncbi:MAG: branched-chain amino acid ABC transporter permease [Candidatus Velthaea sp.]
MRIAWAVCAALAFALPLAVHNPYYFSVIVTGYVFAIAVYGMNIILGYTGLLSLGHAAFFGIGGYAVALLETKAHWPFWPALAAGCAAAVLLGYLVGLISLRTRGNYFAIFTAAIGVMIFTIFTNWQDLTNGNIGVVGIRPPAPIGPLAFDTPAAMYELVLVALVLTMILCARVRSSLTGRTLLAIAANEDLARAVGINVMRVKRLAFMLSTFLAALAGGLFAVVLGVMGPDASGLDRTFDMLLYLVVGGLGTIAGPLIGTMLIATLSQYLQGFQQYQMLVYGPLLIVLVMFFPGGIVGGFDRLRARWVRRPTAAPVAPAFAPETRAH